MAARVDWPRWGWSAVLAIASVPLGVLAGLDPRISIAAAMAVALVLVTFTDLALGLAFFVVLSFVGFPAYGFEDGIVRVVLALAWVALLMTRKSSELEFPTVHPVGTTILLLFFGWVCVSLAWAESTDEVLLSIKRFGLSAILLLIVFTAVRSERDLGRVLIAFIVGAIGAAVYGLFAGTNIDGRLGTTLLDPNILAATLTSAAALSVAIFAIYRSAPARLSIVAALVFSAIAIWLTASRGGLIALAVSLIAAIVLAGRWRVQMAAVAVVLVSTSFVYFAAIAPEDVRKHVTAPVEGQERIHEGRTSLWQVGLRAAEANLVKGVGAGNFKVASRHYLLEPGSVHRSDQIIDNPKVAHNVYIEILAELGVIGLLLFLGMIFFCVGCSIRAIHLYALTGNDRMQMAAMGVAVAQIGILAANFFVSDQYSTWLWLLLGLGPPVLALARYELRNAPSAPRRGAVLHGVDQRRVTAPVGGYSSS